MTPPDPEADAMEYLIRALLRDPRTTAQTVVAMADASRAVALDLSAGDPLGHFVGLLLDDARLTGAEARALHGALVLIAVSAFPRAVTGRANALAAQAHAKVAELAERTEERARDDADRD